MSNTTEIRKYKEGLRLTDLQRDLILGLMLGDGHLETQNKGHTYRLLVEQSYPFHESYAMHLYDVLKPLVLTPPKKVKNDKAIFFRTLSHQSFRFYANLFYKDGKKSVPKFIHKYLNDRVLAYWYMDDGALKGKNPSGISRTGKRLHTEGFTKLDVERLCFALNFLGIETTINKQTKVVKDLVKTYYLLNITAKGEKVLTERIKPYVIESMQYKL
uniref:Putative LAGLIDADG homing endonuclease n=1 Tax=Lobochlamys culleus TaxID=51693 RepID=A0A0S2ID03_9CHLO|nr:putative LAGLIDADG homing endonuclease [Lobochlamys culleus]